VPQTFISYRQVDDAQRERVRAFADKLRACGVEVVLDPFDLDENPGGPNEGWDKWSSDQALKSDFVLIIGTREWFECFEKTQPPGTGLGAACEADDLRHRIYKANGIVPNIRVVIFDSRDAKDIPPKLERYHQFYAERDLPSIVRWLGVLQSAAPTRSMPLSSATPNNLPRLQSFFGRKEELAVIREALDPRSLTWGLLIDGPGGMGKTSLAVRAAYDCPPGQFDQIVFLSVKVRELDDDGVRDLSGLVLPGLLELLNQLARELGQRDIAKMPEEQRTRLLLEALRGKRVLLILDNLESLTKRDRDQLFNFITHLPPGCKALLTSRLLIGSSSHTLVLKKLDRQAALGILAELARRNPLLAKTSEAERTALYAQTDGKPLLLRWTAGQFGRGSCRTCREALDFLRSCPKDNDPLEFVFGDLAGEFTSEVESVLAVLAHFSLPANTEHIAALVDLEDKAIETALHALANQSLVFADQEEMYYVPVPMVPDFFRVYRPDVVAEAGRRLEGSAYALIVENGYEKHANFAALNKAWPTIAAALPRFISGPNERLQVVCTAISTFLEFTGRWDEWRALSREAETQATSAGDFTNAGWRIRDTGWIDYLRGQAKDVLVAADRAAAMWQQAKAGAAEQAAGIRLRGIGLELAKDFSGAIAAYREAVRLQQSLGPERVDVAKSLSDLADAEKSSGDFEAAERTYHEALRIAQGAKHAESIATFTGNLAELALDRRRWQTAELLGREALVWAEKIGRLELIADDCYRIANALVQQSRKQEAIAYARKAVDLHTQLGTPTIATALAMLRQCEE
jgi:tetratricopeptide (TPR) repeat protein